MKSIDNIKIFNDQEHGTILRCHDPEEADEFDDFLIKNLDKEIYFKFENEYVSFFFGKELSVEEVKILYKNFENLKVKD